MDPSDMESSVGRPACGGTSSTGGAAGTARKHLFIINPISFRSEAELDAFIARVKRQFEQEIKAEYEIHVSRFPRYAIRTARRYITRTDPETPVRVYAVGGDGILFDCLNGIVGLPNAELAPVPYGHTNDFIRAFGEGLNDVFRDIPLLASAPVVPTDVLHCGSNYALNLCTVGLESAAIFYSVDIQQKLKTWPRFLRNNSRVYNITYYLGGFMVMFDRKMLTQEYVISIDGEDLSGTYANVNIANGPCYGGDKSAVTSAVPDDGFMDVLMFKGTGPLRGLIRILPYTKGHYDRFPGDFTLKRGKTISIRSKDPLMIDLDGEAFLDTNITIELVKQAVKIAAPNNLSYSRRGAFHE
jgi:diacylglycerol kinase family enzyme